MKDFNPAKQIWPKSTFEFDMCVILVLISMNVFK